MMSKVSLGGGGRPQPPSSSSTSHLSASAPPFTVDRSNSKPMQFSDFQYGSNFAHTWNFASPIPAIQNDEYRGGSESEGDSRWSSMNPSAAKASMHPYFYENVPYGSTGLDNGTPLVTVSECNYELLPTTGLESAGFSSHVDYTQSLSGLDYSSQWYGSGDAKRGERAGNDCTFPFEKITTHDSHHHLKQGCDSCKCGNVFVNDYCASCGIFSDYIGRESHSGLVHTGHSDNAPPLRKDGCLAYDSAWGTSSNVDPISLSLGPSMQARGTSSKSEFTDPISVSLSLGSSVQSPVKYRNPNDPYEKRAQLSGYGVNGSVSVTESFPSSLIRTPNVGLGLGLCRSFSGKSIDASDVSYVPHNEVINNYNISKEKEGRFTSNPGGQECSIPVSQTKSHKVDREEFFSVFPSVLEGPSSGPQAKNPSNSVMRVKFNSQVPKLDLSIGGSFPCDTAQAIRSQEKNLDCLEHHSTVIDSPCWKGSTAFHLSPFDVFEGEATPHTKQRSEHCHMNREHDHPTKSFFGNTNDDQVGYGIVFAAADQGSRTNSPAVQASKGVQCCEYSSKPAEEHYLPQISQTEKLLVNDSFSSTEPNMVTHDNIKEGGAIAVRAAEDVLSSNSSEDRESAQPKEKSTPRLDVQMLTNSMKNISELLLSYHCSDPFALKEQNLEAIEDVISNLHALLPKKTVHLTRPPAPIYSQLGTSNKPGDYFDSHVNTDVRRTEVVHEASVNAQGPRDYQPTYEEMKNCNDCIEKTQNWQPYSQIKDDLDTFLDASMTKNIGPAVSQIVQNASVGERGRANYEKTMTYDDCGEKVPKLQEFFQIKDDLDMFGDDSMTKSLKKVLDENFNCGEEIQPLALLFKNLWLEAEARLCRFNYKARFDRVKIEMEGFKSNQMKESSASSSEKDSGNKNQHGSSSSDVLTNNGKNGSVQETVIQSSVNDPNNLEASVLARLKILKGRNSTELEQSAGQGSDSAPGLNADDSGNHGSGNGRRTCELSPGFTDKTSSEWEHVVKDDAW